MATIASLFGPSAEEIVYSRKKEDEDYARKRALARYQGAGEGLGAFGWAARAGADTGETLRGMFGESIEDPLVSKYNRINQILNEEGGDLNDPATLKRVAEKLQSAGYTNEAVRLYDRSGTLSASQSDLELKKLEYGPKLTKDWVSWDGSKVRKDKQGNFYDSDNTLLGQEEVMSADIYNDNFNVNKAELMRRGKEATERRLSGSAPVSERTEYVTKDTDDISSDTTLDVDPAAAQAALEGKGDSGARPGAGSWGQVVGDVAGIEGGYVPDPVAAEAAVVDEVEEVPAAEEYVRDDSGFPYIGEGSTFEFRPGGPPRKPTYKYDEKGERISTKPPFEFRPDLADTGGLFKDDIKNIMGLDQTYTPPSRGMLQEGRTLTPEGPAYDPAALDAVRYTGNNPMNLEFGQDSERYQGPQDQASVLMSRQLNRDEFEPTDEQLMELMKSLVEIDPSAYSYLLEEFKKSAGKITKPLAEAIKRIYNSGKETEFY